MAAEENKVQTGSNSADTGKPDGDVSGNTERQAAIDILSLGKEILSRVLDDTDVVGVDREKYSWGLGLIESYIKDIEELSSAQPENIRCYECKHGTHSGCGNVYICNVSPELVMKHTGDFYCGYAKRKTDGGYAKRKTDEEVD